MTDDGGLDPTTEAAGRDRWLQKSAVDPVERVPLFAEAMATVAELWTASFCGLASSEGEYTFKGLQALKVEDLPRRRDSLPIFAALRVPSWEAPAGLCLDRAAVSAMIEAFFGGGDDGDDVADDRPVSPIEARIVDVVGGQAAAALTGALKPLLPTRFEFDRTMPKPECSFLGKPPIGILVATFELKAVGRRVEIDLLFPQAAMDARAASWGGDAAAGPVLDEAGWTRQLKSEVSRATLRVQAGMSMRPMSLGAVANLRVGQVLELPAAAGSSVLLHSGDEKLFRCHLGQSAGFYTVRIDEALDPASQPPRKGR